MLEENKEYYDSNVYMIVLSSVLGFHRATDVIFVDFCTLLFYILYTFYFLLRLFLIFSDMKNPEIGKKSEKKQSDRSEMREN